MIAKDVTKDLEFKLQGRWFKASEDAKTLPGVPGEYVSIFAARPWKKGRFVDVRSGEEIMIAVDYDTEIKLQ